MPKPDICQQPKTLLPSDRKSVSTDTQQSYRPSTGKETDTVIQRPLHAVRYSMSQGRWVQTTHCENGIKLPIPSSFRLLTWNVDSAPKNPTLRLTAALHFIRQNVLGCNTPSDRPEPCCILLQQVLVGAFSCIRVNEWVQRNFVAIPSLTTDWPPGATYGNVTLVSRTIPVSQAQILDFSNSEMGHHGLLVDVRLAVPAPRHKQRSADEITRVRIANTHLEPRLQGGCARLEQLRIIAASLQRHDVHGGVVGGDMNAIGPSDSSIAKEVGLTDAWRRRETDEEGFTWGYQPPTPFPATRLDKILWVAGGRLEVEEPVRIGVGERNRSGDWISSHYGLEANVRVLRRD